MAWLNFALITIVFYSLFDLLVKLSSDKLNSYFFALLVNVIATVVLLIFTIYLYFHGEKLFVIKPGGILLTTLAGVAIAGASIFFVKMFATGTNLSVGVPLVRIGMVVLGSILGVVLLKEGFNLKYIIGVLLSLAGLLLVITK